MLLKWWDLKDLLADVFAKMGPWIESIEPKASLFYVASWQTLVKNVWFSFWGIHMFAFEPLIFLPSNKYHCIWWRVTWESDNKFKMFEMEIDVLSLNFVAGIHETFSWKINKKQMMCPNFTFWAPRSTCNNNAVSWI